MFVKEHLHILGGRWFGAGWTGGSSIFPKHPFRQVSVPLFILFFKSTWRLMAIVRHVIDSIPCLSAPTINGRIWKDISRPAYRTGGMGTDNFVQIFSTFLVPPPPPSTEKQIAQLFNFYPDRIRPSSWEQTLKCLSFRNQPQQLQ